jgi:hypothetical protein
MDWLMILPPIVSAVGDLGALAMQAVAERLLTILGALLIGCAGAIIVAAVAWRSVKRVLARRLHAPLIAPSRSTG